MDFRQLEAYVQVIELGSFSKAAEAIYLSQPSVSSYVNALEKELQSVLINRSTKEFSPTAAGKILYENAKEMLALKNNTTERIKNLSGDLNGALSIIASSVPAQYILPKIITSFCHLYPGISFAVKQADTFEVAQEIALQKADIGFAGGIAENDKCLFTEFMAEQLVLIAPNNENFAATADCSLAKLLYNTPFITREKGSGTREQYEEYFLSQGIDSGKITISACFDNTQSIISAVINGLGIAIVSEYAARDFIRQKMLLPIKLKAALPQRKFYYVLKKNFIHSHLADLFIKYLRGCV